VKTFTSVTTGWSRELDHLTDGQRRCGTLDRAARSERKSRCSSTVVVPAQRLFLGPIGFNDDLHLKPLVGIVASSARH